MMTRQKIRTGAASMNDTQQETYDVVIIGGGPAGVSAAI